MIIIIVMIIIRTIMTKIVIKHQEKCNHNQKGGTKDCDNNLNCVWVFFFLTSADNTDNKFVWNP